MNYKNILDLHANGMAVKPKKEYKSPVSPQLLNGYFSDKALAIEHSYTIHGRNFFIMPVHLSPILCLYMTKPWTYRWTDSLKTISMLWGIIICYSANKYLDFYKENKELIDPLYVELIINIDKMEDAMFAAVQNNQKDYIQNMQNFTIERINMLEIYLHKLFKMEEHFKVECVLTPKEYPNASLLEQGFNFRNVINHFFNTKNEVRNVRMKKSTPEDVKYEYIRHFSLNPPIGDLYNGYLDKILVEEYFKFMQLEG